MVILPCNNNLIDDLPLQKYAATHKMQKILEVIEEKPQMIKTASTEMVALLYDGQVYKVEKLLSDFNMKTNGDVKEIIGKISEGSRLEKQTSINKEGQERRDDIKIVSKSVKDSHYQVDLSKDIVKLRGNKVFMISCYARDAYLGRYLIKRNFFYTIDREKFADNAYDEILIKVSSIKDRYYNEIIDVAAIFAQLKTTLDGVISEIKMEEDSIATNIHR